MSIEENIKNGVYSDWSRKSDAMDKLRELSEKVTQTESILSAFFNMREELFCVASARGYFIKVNSKWMLHFGWDEHDFYSHPYKFFIHPDDIEKTEKAEQDMANGIPVKNFVNRYRCKDGTYKTVSWDANPYVDGEYAYTISKIVPDEHNEGAISG